MRKLDIKPGDRYGRLVIIQESSKRNGYRRFLCKCDCGNKKIIVLNALHYGRSRSCGCLRNESHFKHRQSQSRLYHTWTLMRSRCYNPNDKRYSCYGGRGITICDQWGEFVNFQTWALSHGYSEGLSIERINNDGNYEPRNCTWIPLPEQARNRRNNHFISHNGVTKILAEWAKATGLSQSAIRFRLKYGWSVEEALYLPLRSACVKH